MNSVFEISFKTQTFNSFIFPYSSDYSIFVNLTIIFPTNSLNVSFCFNCYIKRINLKCF